MSSRRSVVAILLTSSAVTVWLIGDRVLAHCDTMDGPIVPEARRALDTGDVLPLLKWVREQDEAAIRDAFVRSRTVRDGGDDVREMADQLFLETLVRIHRAGEGEPFAGLKPAGSAPPIFSEADAALDAGSVDALAEELSKAIRNELQGRFDTVMDRRTRINESVQAGRAYVAAYVRYMHFVEGIHDFVEHGARGDVQFDAGGNHQHVRAAERRNHGR